MAASAHLGRSTWLGNYLEREGLARLTIIILLLTSVGMLAYTWGYAEGVHNSHEAYEIVLKSPGGSGNAPSSSSSSSSSNADSSKQQPAVEGTLAVAGSALQEPPPAQQQELPAKEAPGLNQTSGTPTVDGSKKQHHRPKHATGSNLPTPAPAGGLSAGAATPNGSSSTAGAGNPDSSNSSSSSSSSSSSNPAPTAAGGGSSSGSGADGSSQGAQQTQPAQPAAAVRGDDQLPADSLAAFKDEADHYSA